MLLFCVLYVVMLYKFYDVCLCTVATNTSLTLVTCITNRILCSVPDMLNFYKAKDVCKNYVDITPSHRQLRLVVRPVLLVPVVTSIITKGITLVLWNKNMGYNTVRCQVENKRINGL